jgi:cytidylate kinase
MKTLVFIHGANGVGKSTLCQTLYQRLDHTAWLESEWCRMTHPFTWNEEAVTMTVSNVTHMLRSYLTCSRIEYVIFSYGFHGPRKRIWEAVLCNLGDLPYTLCPITITCSEDENLIRMKHDERDAGRIQRALATRHLYEDLPYPRIDTTHLTIEETVEQAVEILQHDSTASR